MASVVAPHLTIGFAARNEGLAVALAGVIIKIIIGSTVIHLNALASFIDVVPNGVLWAL